MATEFKLPELGENIEKAQVVSVMVAPGDSVNADHAVIEVETDKAVMEVPIPTGGIIKQVMVAQGDTLKVGDTILSFEASSTPAPAAPAKPAPDPKPAAKAPAPADPAPTAAPAPAAPAPAPAADQAPINIQASADPAPANLADDRLPVFASPTIRKLAREIGVDITRVQGSGPGGRISEDDVKKHARRGGSASSSASSSPALAMPPLPDFAALGPIQRQPMTMLAKKTAQHMALCWAAIPHVTLHEDVDTTDLEKFRLAHKQSFERNGSKLTVTAILVKLITNALKQFPILNASFDTQTQEIILKKFYNIGVAADTPRGLVVPVLKNADTMTLTQIASDLGQLAEKARTAKLALEDMQGGTFTITNLGGIGVGHFTPIVNHPEVAILGVGTARSTLVNIDGHPTPRLIMPISLSFDHRIVNGADGARFLNWIKTAIEQPLAALLT